MACCWGTTQTDIFIFFNAFYSCLSHIFLKRRCKKKGSQDFYRVVDNKINKRLQKWLEMISGLETPKSLARGPTLGRSAQCVSYSALGGLSQPQLRAGATCQTLSRGKKEADWKTDWKTGTQIEKGRSTDSPRKAWGPSKVGVDDKVKEETEKTHRMCCSTKNFSLKSLTR